MEEQINMCHASTSSCSVYILDYLIHSVRQKGNCVCVSAFTLAITYRAVVWLKWFWEMLDWLLKLIQAPGFMMYQKGVVYIETQLIHPNWVQRLQNAGKCNQLHWVNRASKENTFMECMNDYKSRPMQIWGLRFTQVKIKAKCISTKKFFFHMEIQK